MQWNWQQKDWPNFFYDISRIQPYETEFLTKIGFVYGAYQHVDDDNKKELLVEIISEEALNTSEIEGEHLDRNSVQSSIRKNLGLQQGDNTILPREKGIAEMMTNLYKTYDVPLNHEYLYNWHCSLTNGRTDINNIGTYRTHEESMQIVSGYIHKPKIHFEAPPSSDVPNEMTIFVQWYNNAAKEKSASLRTIINAAIAHLYFVSIHPFEDGNGRIARALAEKIVSQAFGHPVLMSLSTIIQRNRKQYYQILEQSNQELEITEYIIYFANTVLNALQLTSRTIEFTIKKTRIFDTYKTILNERQLKALQRFFREGLDGFQGGLSAGNYKSITGASNATTTRDLQEMVKLGVLNKKGQLRHTRYSIAGLD
ncbi:MAG: DUF4172 domain-containing protein [Candidatus Margulisiibacteriota bacterium]|nr:MAG: cell filamentation protein Fic [Candidatus Margulisbacteria bacterium GWE2_39_32]PZM83820.1 MAG: DUF4172 domain-containing protein [Candidatus Margulisiibacteriota bacterium]